MMYDYFYGIQAEQFSFYRIPKLLFTHPGFQALLSDIEEDRVGTLIVKDMSRLGRNYLEVGFYTEMLFPKKRARFIAINSNVDSANPNEEEQYFFPNTHEPIVSQELWDRAQRNRRIVERKRINNDIKDRSVFLGLLYCSTCGQKLSIGILENDKTGNIIANFNCRSYRGTVEKSCTSHYINEQDLKNLLAEYLCGLRDTASEQPVLRNQYRYLHHGAEKGQAGSRESAREKLDSLAKETAAKLSLEGKKAKPKACGPEH